LNVPGWYLWNFWFFPHNCTLYLLKLLFQVHFIILSWWFHELNLKFCHLFHIIYILHLQ
jgi:hypothetical protein